MSNTYSSTKKRLIDLLRNQDHRVIVLKGKWGTGKTRLWSDVKTELYPNKESIYVSLFGVKTVNELKLRIFKNICSNEETATGKLFDTGSGVLKGFLKRFTGYSIEDGVLLWLPDLVKGKLIVIDDIERKHKSLEIDELMGMLDEYSENHEVRFLILLNTDKLSDNNLWASLHEKVVDVELTLDPLPSEAFDIAVGNGTEAYLTEIKAAVEIININNIRIIKKIITTVAYILKESDVENVPTSNWIPSTVLMTASHYRAKDGLPPLEFITSYNSLSFLMTKKDKEPSQDEINWGKLLRELGINLPDEFETILFEYLQSGLLNTDKLKAQFEEYKTNDYCSVVDSQLRDFFDNAYWNHHKSEDELVSMARELLPIVGKLNYQTVTCLVNTIGEDIGNTALAQEFLDTCLNAIESSEEHKKLKIVVYGDEIHPIIRSKLNEIARLKNPPLTLTETVEQIIANSSWGEREKIILRNSTIEQYESAINQLESVPLRKFMTVHVEWINHRNHDADFKNGTENFIAACSKICADEPNSRLSKIIRRLFNNNNLSEKLSGVES